MMNWLFIDSVFGHRGFFHSPFFGLLLSTFVVGVFFRHTFRPDSRLCFKTIRIRHINVPHHDDTQKADMSPLKTVSEEEIQRINRLQRNTFDKLYHLFEPPLPEGVLERLEKIVPHGKINRGETILDVESGTGILIPIIKKYEPRWIYVCDLSVAMLEQLSSKKYPNVETIVADVRDLRLPGSSIDCR